MKELLFFFILLLISIAPPSQPDINPRGDHDLTGTQQRLDEAIAEYQRAIERNPANGTAYYHLGLAYVQKQRLDEAIVAFQIAVSLRPDDAMAYTGLGLAYVQKGSLDQAIAALTRASVKTSEVWVSLLLITEKVVPGCLNSHQASSATICSIVGQVLRGC